MYRGDDAGRILLAQREDFEIWSLPGGHVEDGESVAEAAIREVKEETGVDVVLTGLVGIYYRPQGWSPGGSHNVVFAGKPTGGTLTPQSDEVLDVGYFAQDDLPDPLFWGHRQRILDAMIGVGGSVAWTQNTEWPFDQNLDRQGIYDARDRSGLTRFEFYQKHFDRPGPGGDVLEVGR